MQGCREVRVGTMNDPCGAMVWAAESPINFAFGNGRWHIVESGPPGVLTFVAPSPKPDAGVEKLFQLTLSEALPFRRDEITYAPHRYGLRREFLRGRRDASLVFLPERSAAVLHVTPSFSSFYRTQLLLKTWSGGPPKDEEIFYPHLDARRRQVRFRKGSFHVEIALRFGRLRWLTANEGWHGTRLGFESAGPYAVLFVCGVSAADARREMERLQHDADRAEESGRTWWNAYFAACPLVALRQPLRFRNGVFGTRHAIAPDALLVRQLWHYYHALAGVVHAPWCQATPLQVADRFHFNDAFCNDNTYGAMLLALTNKAPLLRAHLLHMTRHMLRADGHFLGCIDPTGASRFGELNSGVPSLPHAVGHYVRCTGDLSLLDEDAGGLTVWAKLKRWERRVLAERDSNRDGLIEWNIVWESGEDNKDTAFFKNKGLMEWYKQYQIHGMRLKRTAFYRRNVCPTTPLNEQVFHYWSLLDMAELARRRGEASAAYLRKAERIRTVVAQRHWNPRTRFYHDYDVKADALWHAKNLDAFYVMYFERDPRRAAALVRHLEDPREFNLSLLPTLSRDDVHFDPESYWAGAAWPREHGFVALALAAQGYRSLALQWIARALCCAEGPIVPEFVNPLSDPPRRHGSITGMVMAALNQVALLDVCGLRTWSGPVRREPVADLPVRRLNEPPAGAHRHIGAPA